MLGLLDLGEGAQVETFTLREQFQHRFPERGFSRRIGCPEQVLLFGDLPGDHLHLRAQVIHCRVEHIEQFAAALEVLAPVQPSRLLAIGGRKPQVPERTLHVQRDQPDVQTIHCLHRIAAAFNRQE